ncbi:guanine nucleotide-binding protein subunit beta-like protein 1 isoform X5 [Dama dama]|uniref:guanine nucleotide-binding protein subunit beta-like protein 1 isoform X5 n=1 Tax=Dama dama TaxID=30532 RepID=UPI002A36B363|nr:guanine nucleotide-binding protein subunit beta-like protein 1 isoform X5 [Dama dama]
MHTQPGSWPSNARPLAKGLPGNLEAESSSRPLLLAGYEDGSLVLWDVSTRKVCSRVACHSEPVMGLALDPRRARGVSGSAEKALAVWSLEGQQALQGKQRQKLKTQSVWGMSSTELEVPLTDVLGTPGRRRQRGGRRLAGPHSAPSQRCATARPPAAASPEPLVLEASRGGAGPQGPGALVSTGARDPRAHQPRDRRRQDPARQQDPGHCGLGPPCPRVSVADDAATGRAGLPQRHRPLRGLRHCGPAGRGLRGPAHQHLVALPAHVTQHRGDAGTEAWSWAPRVTQAPSFPGPTPHHDAERVGPGGCCLRHNQAGCWAPARQEAVLRA